MNKHSLQWQVFQVLWLLMRSWEMCGSVLPTPLDAIFAAILFCLTTRYLDNDAKSLQVSSMDDSEAVGCRL